MDPFFSPFSLIHLFIDSPFSLTSPGSLYLTINKDLDVRKRCFLPATDWDTEAGAKSEGNVVWGSWGEKVDFPEVAAGFQWHQREHLLTAPQCPFPSMPGVG